LHDFKLSVTGPQADSAHLISEWFLAPIFACVRELAGDPAMLARYFQMEEGELKSKAVTDPRAAVAVDVALLRTIPALPGGWLVSGLIYDVATGLVEVVVAPAPIRNEPS
jgi:hypothetical protein